MKGARDKAENFRPVSLTCVLGKVYQKLVRRHIIDHAEGSVTRDQHGFISGRSCTSNLLEAFDTIIDMMDEGLPVDILYFDFRKAFDTVPHHRLLVKLENMGITGETLEIIKDFLSDREMWIVVGDSFSEVLNIVSGVPQGSVLGPILFWTRSFESEEIVQYHFSDINWAQGQNMSHLINCQCINGYLKTLVRKLKLVSCF